MPKKVLSISLDVRNYDKGAKSEETKKKLELLALQYSAYKIKKSDSRLRSCPKKFYL